MTLRRFVPAAAVLLAPAVALAHPGHPGHSHLGFVAGLAHPFTGADHLLAMVAVGLWAALRGGRAIWAWPAAFVVALLAGYGLGQTSPDLPLVQPMILASVIVLGALTAANARVPEATGVVLIGLFGLAHGFAHGAESPGAVATYPLGMALATAGLHSLGLGLALILRRYPVLVRWLGAGAAIGGLILVVTG
jgi:urease accessory protein